MTLYRRNLPHLEDPGRTYFITFNTTNDFMLPDAAKSLVLNHCLYDDGKRYTLHAVVVLGGSLWQDESFDHMIRSAESRFSWNMVQSTAEAAVPPRYLEKLRNESGQDKCTKSLTSH